MVGQRTDKRGYARNFAYRFRNTVATSSMDDGHVEELNPVVRDSVIDNRLYVQMDDSVRVTMRKVVGLLGDIAELIATGVVGNHK
jgi:hypothetical protein